MYHVVGCNHGIQVGIGGFAALNGVEANEQRDHFRALLTEICAENEIQIVLEEDGTIEETTGQQLAATEGVRWENINTTNQDLDRMGIPRNYLTGPYSDEQKDQWTRQRESLMVAKIVVHRKTAENAIVICGFDHLEPIVEQLAARGIAVRELDYRTSGWYRAGVFHE